MAYKAKNNGNLKSEKVPYKLDTIRNESKSLVKEVENNASLETSYNSHVNDSPYKNTTDKKNVGENHNQYASKRSNIRSEKQ